MRVCIDIQSAIAQRAGVGRYTRMLAENLPAFKADDDLSGFYFDFKRRCSIKVPAGMQDRAVRWAPGILLQQAWKRLSWPPFDWLAGSADVYHFPNFVIPPLRRGRTVVTIHDVSFLRHAEFTETRNLAYLRARMADTVERADVIITDSEFCAGEIAELMPPARGKTFAVHLGIGPEFAPVRPPELRGWLASRGLVSPYLIAVGTLEPRKNYPFLLDVFEQMHEFDGDLVIVGRRGWKYEPIIARIAASPRARRVRLLENVTDTDLPFLYSGAKLLLFPSIYEGFGFPPLEAMACGVPVLSSNRGSLPEVLGDGAWLLQGFDSGEWAAAAMSLLNENSERAGWIECGRRQAGRYTWRHTARRTWELYRRVMQ